MGRGMPEVVFRFSSASSAQLCIVCDISIFSTNIMVFDWI